METTLPLPLLDNFAFRSTLYFEVEIVYATQALLFFLYDSGLLERNIEKSPLKRLI